QRERRQHREPVEAEQEEVRRAEEQHQHQVSDHHVQQQSQRERHGAEHEGRDQLDDRDDRDEVSGNAAGNQRVLHEAAEAVLTDTRVDEANVGDNGNQERNADDARALDVEAGDDTHQVEEQNAEEEHRQQRYVLLAFLLANDLVGLAAHEAKAELNDLLQATRNNLQVARAEEHEQHQKHGRDDLNKVDSRELEGGPFEEKRLREEVANRRRVELDLIGHRCDYARLSQRVAPASRADLGCGVCGGSGNEPDWRINVPSVRNRTSYSEIGRAHVWTPVT